MTQAPDISVIVVNYNGGERVKGCLSALSRQTDVLFETIVVDNASRDGSREWLRAQRPAIGLVEAERNLGFAAGNNLGASRARGRYLAFLNNDAEPAAGWLAALKRALEQNAWAALATSKILYKEDPALIDSAGDGFSRAGGAYKMLHGQWAEAAVEPREVFGACGAAFMMRRDLFEEIRGFDEDFFLSHEDVDLSYRVQLLGLGCVYVPEAVVLHAVSASLGRVSAAAVYYGQRNLEWVYWKNTPSSLLLRTFIPHAVYVLAAGLYHARIGRFIPFVRGKLAAVRGMPGLLRKRRSVQRALATPPERLLRLMDRHWWGVKWREKRFDLKAARRHA